MTQHTHKHAISNARQESASEDKYLDLSLSESSLVLREETKEGHRSLQMWRKERDEESWGTPALQWPSMNSNLQSGWDLDHGVLGLCQAARHS